VACINTVKIVSRGKTILGIKMDIYIFQVKIFQFASVTMQPDVLREWMYSSTHSLTWALDGDERSASRPGSFTPRDRAPGTHWT
jgi:hypothetical protein